MLQTNWKLYIYYVCLSHGGVLEMIRKTNIQISSFNNFKQLFWWFVASQWQVCYGGWSRSWDCCGRRWIIGGVVEIGAGPTCWLRQRFYFLLLLGAVTVCSQYYTQLNSALSSAPTPVKWSRDSASPPLSYSDQSTEIFLQIILPHSTVMQCGNFASLWKSFPQTTSNWCEPVKKLR